MSIFDKFIGQHVVVRTYAAGVHLGTLVAAESQPTGVAVVLADSRRLWKWSGAFTLSEVATIGVHPDASRIAAAVPELLVLNAIEIIPTTADARSTFDATHE